MGVARRLLQHSTYFFFFKYDLSLMLIPGVMFCNRKHLSLSSGEDLNSLDMAGSLERASLPGRDQMSDHCESISKA